MHKRIDQSWSVSRQTEVSVGRGCDVYGVGGLPRFARGRGACLVLPALGVAAGLVPLQPEVDHWLSMILHRLFPTFFVFRG